MIFSISFNFDIFSILILVQFSNIGMFSLFYKYVYIFFFFF